MTDLLAQRYRPLRTLGEGAMGRVLLVDDVVARQQVALKVVSLGMAGGGEAEKSLLQFKQEFRLMSRLRHPNCCAVYDYGVLDDGAPYFTMEVVPGQGLDEAGPLDEATFRNVFAQLLIALDYVHQQGFVHCDLKPANVRVRPDGSVKLMDFGLMELAGQPAIGLRGTPPYLAPEVIKRAPLDRRADLYSAGALAFEMLTGRPPFPRPTLAEILRAHLGDRCPPLSQARAGLPRELDFFIQKLLAKEPADRFQSAGEALEAMGHDVPAGFGGSLLASPLVGRERELAALGDRLAALRRGERGGAYWISGGAGTGKTRLLEELRCQAQLEEVPFVRGASHERRGVPYAPITAIVRGLLPYLRRDLPDQLAAEAPVLVALLPELGVAPAPPMDTPKNEALRLHGALAGLLAALAARQPFIMLLEDWRGADEASREFLAYMLRNLGDAPVLALTSTRRGPDAGGGPEGFEALPLGGLAPAAVARMLAGMLGERDVAAADAERVTALTQGNPLVIEQLLDDLVKRQVLARQQGRWNLAEALDALAGQADLGGLARLRLAELPPEALRVARAAAAHGQPARLELLQAMAGMEDEALFEAIEALGRRQVLVTNDDGAYALARQDYQAMLYDETPADELRDLHARAAADLERAVAERTAGDSLAEVPVELVTALASHGLRGVLGERAIAWALEAGRRSLALYVLSEAETFLQAVIDLMEAAPADKLVAERLEAYRGLAEVRRYSRRTEEALPLLARAGTIAEAMGDRRTLGYLLTTQAKAVQVLGRYDEAIALCERAAAESGAAGDDVGLARCLLTRGRVLFFKGDAEAARAATGEALAAAERGGEKGTLGQAFAFLGYLTVATDPDRLEEGVTQLKRAIGLLKEAGDRPGLNDAYVLLGEAETQLGHFKNARLAYRESLKFGQACALKEDEILALANLAGAAVELGEYAEARDCARRAVEMAGRSFIGGFAMALEGFAEAHLGAPAAGLARMREAGGLAAELKNAYLEALVGLRDLELLVALGRHDVVAALGGPLEEKLRATGQTEPLGRLDVLRAEAAMRTGDLAAAEAPLARARETATRTRAKGLQVLVLEAQARLKLLGGAWDEAQVVAAEGLALARSIGAAAHVAELHGIQGDAVLGEGGRAADHFHAMWEAAEAIGAPRLQALARFGLAAAEPSGAEAAERADLARRGLEAYAMELDADGRKAFLALREHRRVVDGAYRAHGPAARRKPQPDTGPLNLNLNLGGLGRM